MDWTLKGEKALKNIFITLGLLLVCGVAVSEAQVCRASLNNGQGGWYSWEASWDSNGDYHRVTVYDYDGDEQIDRTRETGQDNGNGNLSDDGDHSYDQHNDQGEDWEHHDENDPNHDTSTHNETTEEGVDWHAEHITLARWELLQSCPLLDPN